MRFIRIAAAAALCCMLLSGCPAERPAEAEPVTQKQLAEHFEREKTAYTREYDLGSDQSRTSVRYYRDFQGYLVVNDFYDVSTDTGSGELLEIRKSKDTMPSETVDPQKLVEAFENNWEIIDQLTHSDTRVISEVKRDENFFVLASKLTPVLTLSITDQGQFGDTLEIECVNMLDGSEIDYDSILCAEYLETSFE